MTPAMCLAVAMFFEARAEGSDAMRAVGEVVINRVAHEKYPDTVCDVVEDKCEFSFMCDGKTEKFSAYKDPGDVEAAKIAIEVAEDLLSNKTMMFPENITHYHATYVTPYWSTHKDFEVAGMIGKHIFYTCKNYC